MLPALLAGGLAAGCQLAGQPADENPVAHPRLVADHHAMGARHHRMEAADSAMEAGHAAALPRAHARQQDQWPVYQVLATHHRAFMRLHRRLMQHHAAALARHAALEKAHATGRFPGAQMAADHTTLFKDLSKP